MNPKLPAHFTLTTPEHVAPLRELFLALNLKSELSEEFLLIALENVILFDAKQQDYGSGNISEFGIFGVVVRLNDKFKRIANLFRSGRRRRALNEAVRDTFRDISNYSIIAYMLETGKWPKE